MPKCPYCNAEVLTLVHTTKHVGGIPVNVLSCLSCRGVLGIVNA